MTHFSDFLLSLVTSQLKMNLNCDVDLLSHVAKKKSPLVFLKELAHGFKKLHSGITQKIMTFSHKFKVNKLTVNSKNFKTETYMKQGHKVIN